MRRITTDSLSNQNISSALLVATYTADADRFLYINVRCDQAAGNGDYICYMTRQHLGAGPAFVQVPRTTATVPSGVTSIAFPSIGLPVKNTDVIKVYLTGLAGDTTTPDTVVEWWEDELFITVGSAGAGLTALAAASALSAVAAYLDTEIAEILAKVNNLPADPADASDIAALIATAQSSLNTIAGYTDTLEAASTTIQGYVDTLESRLPAALDGGRIPAVLAATPPTAAEINTALSTAHGSGSWLTGAGALGSGSETVRIRALSSGDPVDGCAVWITTDEAGSNVVAGTVFTDALGYTPTLLLDPGTYYVWKQAAGVTFDDVPESITVVNA